MTCTRNVLLGVAALTFWLTGCADTTAPGGDGLALRRSSTTLESWTLSSLSTAETTTESGATTTGGETPENTLQHAPTAPPLMTYSTSFLATQGKPTKFQVNYNIGTAAYPIVGPLFLEITIPRDAEILGPDGNPIPRGGTAEITVDIDPVTYLVRFGPHGSTFLGRKPAQLVFGYLYADMTGHSESDSMTVWYQPEEGTEWTAQETTVDRVGHWIVTDIYHFSNYAVAW